MYVALRTYQDPQGICIKSHPPTLHYQQEINQEKEKWRQTKKVRERAKDISR